MPEACPARISSAPIEADCQSFLQQQSCSFEGLDREADRSEPGSMASERQIKANRQNCKRSTGPATPAGKEKSSRNAFRHGLSRPMLHRTGDTVGFVTLSAQPGHRACPDVTELMHAKMELLRVAAVRYAMCERLLQEPGANALRDIARIDRYARAAFARQRRLLTSRKVTFE